MRLPRTRGQRQRLRHHIELALAMTFIGILVLLAAASSAHAQDRRVADLTMDASGAPARLVGYGLVIGLDGTGDRPSSSRNGGGGVTVQSVANLLARFHIEVPTEQLRTQNAAAVLVTAEVSRYLRAGGRFPIHVSSIGDAKSLKGGVLLVTPLVSEVGGQPVATAQGPLLITQSDAGGASGMVRWRPSSASGGNTATIPEGGILEGDLARPAATSIQKLILKSPDLIVAARISAAINAASGAGTAKVEDAGAIALTLKGNPDEQVDQLARIRDLRVRPEGRATVMIDARSGLVVTGGDVTLGTASVRHANMLIVIGVPADTTPRAPIDSSALPSFMNPGAPTTVVRLPGGSAVLALADALRAQESRPEDVGAILLALQAVGALVADVVVR